MTKGNLIFPLYNNSIRVQNSCDGTRQRLKGDGACKRGGEGDKGACDRDLLNCDACFPRQRQPCSQYL